MDKYGNRNTESTENICRNGYQDKTEMGSTIWILQGTINWTNFIVKRISTKTKIRNTVEKNKVDDSKKTPKTNRELEIQEYKPGSAFIADGMIL